MSAAVSLEVKAAPKRSTKPGSPVRFTLDASAYHSEAPTTDFSVKPSIRWEEGPNGRDSGYDFQGLGWPWARTNDGRDLITGIRLSAIGDGSCYYHSLYKAIGKLRLLENIAPFFNDLDFIKTLDYLDVDYRDPASLLAYVEKKLPPAEFLKDTFTHRQFLVDTFRNDLYRWFLQPAINPDTSSYYTEAEARTAINSDIRNMKVWIKQDALNPDRVKVETTDIEASQFLDLLLGGSYDENERVLHRPGRMQDVYAVYAAAGPAGLQDRLESAELQSVYAYIADSVVNNLSTNSIETGIKEARLNGVADPVGVGLAAGYYTLPEAIDLVVDKLLDRKDTGLIPTVVKSAAVLTKSTFRQEVQRAYEYKLSSQEMINRLKGTDVYRRIERKIRDEVTKELKTSNPQWYLDYIDGEIAENAAEMEADILAGESEYTLDEIPTLQAEWIEMMKTIGLERLEQTIDEIEEEGLSVPNLAVDHEVQVRMSPDRIRKRAMEFFPTENWGILGPLMADEKQNPFDIFTVIDQQLATGVAGFNVKKAFSDRLTGDYLEAIKEYIDMRFKLLTDVKNQCGFTASRYVYEAYEKAYLEDQVVDTDSGWALVHRSIDRQTGHHFTNEKVEELKSRDPRTIKINGIPLACAWTWVKQQSVWAAQPQEDKEMMRLKLNINYFMMDFGFFLRTQVYFSNIRSIRARLPVYHGREDAGEDILPWLSRLLGLNSHIINCHKSPHGSFVWYYRTYTSGDLDTERPDTNHVFINNCYGHYEPFGTVDRQSDPPRRDDITTYFTSDHPLVVALRQYWLYFSPEGKRLNVQGAYNLLKERKEVAPAITTPKPHVYITSLVRGQEVIEGQLRDISQVASGLSRETELPLPLPLPLSTDLLELPPLPGGIQPLRSSNQHMSSRNVSLPSFRGGLHLPPP